MSQEQAITVALDRMGPRAWVDSERVEYPKGRFFWNYMAGVIHDDPVDGPVQGVFFSAHSWLELVQKMKDDDENCARARAAATPTKGKK